MSVGRLRVRIGAGLAVIHGERATLNWLRPLAPQFFGDGPPGHLVADSASTRVVRFPWQVPDGASAYFKFYRPKGTWRRVADCFRPAKAVTEARNLRALAALGLPTPDVLAWGELRVGGAWLCGSFLVTRELPGTRSLADLLQESAPSGEWPDPRFLRRGIPALAALTARLHTSGWRALDLHFRNVLVDLAARERGEARFHIIDLPRAYRRRGAGGVHDLGVRFDLMCLDKHADSNFSRWDRLRFFVHYRREVGEREGDRRLLELVDRMKTRWLAKRDRKLSETTRARSVSRRRGGES